MALGETTVTVVGMITSELEFKRISSSGYGTEQGRPRSIPEVEASAIGPNLMVCVAPIHRGKRPAVRASPRHAKWHPEALIER